MNKQGLLFAWSGQNQFDADFARGSAQADFAQDASLEADETHGRALRCGAHVRMSWRAPGNLYAQAGTISFYWRAVTALSRTPFPIFRVGYIDHSSWDAVFLRVDWNDGGFEAFVTDLNLSRYCLRAPCRPDPQDWTRLTVSWQENGQMCLYVGDTLADSCPIDTVLDAGLDRFGLHGRAVSHWNVSSSFNFIRTGDFASIALYDRPMTPAQIDGPDAVPHPDGRGAARLRQYGLDQENLPRIGAQATVRKVEIADAYDQKRWWYKSCDGIRETSWPGVFNRSRLRGRDDVFQLPDWDCYSTSGKQITYHLPDEPVNVIQIAGSASGQLSYAPPQGALTPLFDRQEGVERSSHRFETRVGGRIRFENQWIEEPIGDFSALYLSDTIAQTLPPLAAPGGSQAPQTLTEAVLGRFVPQERQTLVFDGHPLQAIAPAAPVYHLMAPLQNDAPAGLNGAALAFCLNRPARFSLLVRDPILPYRSLIWFSFAADAGAHTLFADTRNRILQPNAWLYALLVCDRPLSSAELAQLRFGAVQMPAQQAAAEHGADRFTQVRDVYGHLTEESPREARFALWRRWQGDLNDLLTACPAHPGAARYRDTAKWRELMQTRPIDEALAVFDAPYQTPPKPAGMPEWAHQQLTYLKRYDELIRFWVDHRQIENGELGGGLSDDGDFTAMWVPLVQMGVSPEKYAESLKRCLDAFYQQGMFTNGLPSIQTDDLHASEDGLVTLAQALALDDGDPENLERAMETARAAFWLTGVNAAGHRHIRSSFFSGSVMAQEMPWGTSGPDSYIALTPLWLLARFNRSPQLLELLRQLADGLLAHVRDGKIFSQIDFQSDADTIAKSNHGQAEFSLLWPAYVLLGDEKYLEPVLNRVPLAPVPPRETASDSQIASRYAQLNRQADVCAYYNTLGYPWVDRVFFENLDIQYDRLGGVGFLRFNAFYPRHRFSWRFNPGLDAFDVAIRTVSSAPDAVTLRLFCAAQAPGQATLTGAQIRRGLWRVNGAQPVLWGPHLELPVAIVPGEQTLTLTLEIPLPQISGYDLGVSQKDLRFFAHGLQVTVHSLGRTAAPQTDIVLMRGQRVLRRETIPPLPAADDLYPKTWQVNFYLHGLEDLTGCRVVIDPDSQLTEITRANNEAVVLNDPRDHRQKNPTRRGGAMPL